MDRGVERTSRSGERVVRSRQRWRSGRISRNLCFKSEEEEGGGR